MKINKEEIQKFIRNKKNLNETSSSYQWDMSLVNMRKVSPGTLDTMPYMLMLAESSIVGQNTLYIDSDISEEQLEDITDRIMSELKKLNSPSTVKPTYSAIKENALSQMYDGITSDQVINLVCENASAYTEDSDWNQVLASLSKDIVKEYKKLDNSELSFINEESMILDEGMIKIPQKAYSYCSAFVSYYIISMLWETIYEESDKKQIENVVTKLGYDYDQLLKEKSVLDSNNRIKFDSSKGIVGMFAIKLEAGELPYDNKLSTMLSINLMTNNKEPMGYSNLRNKFPLIGINFFKLHTLLQKAKNDPDMIHDAIFIEQLEYLKNDMLNTITHELMHVVQLVVLGPKEKESLSKYGREDSEGKVLRHAKDDDRNDIDDHEKYLLSPVEYDPAINDIIGEFRGLMNSLSNYVGHISLDTRKELLKKFLGSSEYQDKLPKSLQSNQYASIIETTFKPREFMTLLKSKDHKRWKLAVKKIFSEIFE